MPIYMDYEGVPGDVTAEGWQGKIELQSFSYGISRSITSPMGGTKDRESSAPVISEAVVTKIQDKSSTYLTTEALLGEGKKCSIFFVKTDKDKLECYMHYEFRETLISSFSQSSGGDRPVESLSLNFTAMLYTFHQMGDLNETGEPERIGWSLGRQASL
jgi:type VI secretion system secreted protein Hcp